MEWNFSFYFFKCLPWYRTRNEWADRPNQRGQKGIHHRWFWQALSPTRSGDLSVRFDTSVGTCSRLKFRIFETNFLEYLKRMLTRFFVQLWFLSINSNDESILASFAKLASKKCILWDVTFAWYNVRLIIREMRRKYSSAFLAFSMFWLFGNDKTSRQHHFEKRPN